MSISPQLSGSAPLSAPSTRAAALPQNRLAAVVSRWWVPFAASSVFVVSGHLLIKAGLNAGITHSGVGTFDGLLRMLNGEVASGLLIYLLGSVCWMLAVAQQEISFLYPLSSVNYVLVVFASFILFHETISARRAFGVALIVLGMVLMNWKTERH
jgi:drug/metabolite transporter (DMT)-like permease